MVGAAVTHPPVGWSFSGYIAAAHMDGYYKVTHAHVTGCTVHVIRENQNKREIDYFNKWILLNNDAVDAFLYYRLICVIINRV